MAKHFWESELSTSHCIARLRHEANRQHPRRMLDEFGPPAFALVENDRVHVCLFDGLGWWGEGDKTSRILIQEFTALLAHPQGDFLAGFWSANQCLRERMAEFPSLTSGREFAGPEFAGLALSVRPGRAEFAGAGACRLFHLRQGTVLETRHGRSTGQRRDISFHGLPADPGGDLDVYGTLVLEPGDSLLLASCQLGALLQTKPDLLASLTASLLTTPGLLAPPAAPQQTNLDPLRPAPDLASVQQTISDPQRPKSNLPAPPQQTISHPQLPKPDLLASLAAPQQPNPDPLRPNPTSRPSAAQPGPSAAQPAPSAAQSDLSALSRRPNLERLASLRAQVRTTLASLAAKRHGSPDLEASLGALPAYTLATIHGGVGPLA